MRPGLFDGFLLHRLSSGKPKSYAASTSVYSLRQPGGDHDIQSVHGQPLDGDHLVIVDEA